MKDTNISPSRLKEFCDTIIMQAREVLYEREEDILKAWHENIAEAQENDKKFPPLKLGIGATVDLENSTIETTLRFTAVYQSSLSTEISDPDQAELPGMTRAETLKTAVKEAAMSGKLAKGLLSKKHGVTGVSIAVDGEAVYDSAEDDLDTTEGTDMLADPGPRIVDADDDQPGDGNVCEYDRRAMIADTVKVLVGKSAKDKKHTAIDKLGLELGAEGLKAALAQGGDKIAPVFTHYMQNLIFDIETAEAEEFQPEGKADDY